MLENLDSEDYLFENREDAARQLLEALPHDVIEQERWIFLCLASGAVPIVEYIANALEATFDVLFVEPIWAPNNDECQIAMVSECEEIVIHQNLVDSFGISLDYIYGEARRRYQHTILEYQKYYRKSLPLSYIKNRNVVLIDEGCETGLSTVCALKTVLKMGAKKVSVATPIIADDLYAHLEMKVDKIYTNYKIKDFIEVGYYYKTIDVLERKYVRSILEQSKWYLPLKGEK